MLEFKRQGVAIVFVSHNLQAVISLCDRALYLQHEVRAYGDTAEVIEGYVRSAGQAPATSAKGDVEICNAELVSEQAPGSVVVSPGTRSPCE